MEYVPLNIKQEPATLQRSETTTVNGSTSSCSNNNSSQAAPDSVENKVSKTHTHTYRQGIIIKKTQKCLPTTSFL